VYVDPWGLEEWKNKFLYREEREDLVILHFERGVIAYKCIEEGEYVKLFDSRYDERPEGYLSNVGSDLWSNGAMNASHGARGMVTAPWNMAKGSFRMVQGAGTYAGYFTEDPGGTLKATGDAIVRLPDAVPGMIYDWASDPVAIGGSAGDVMTGAGFVKLLTYFNKIRRFNKAPKRGLNKSIRTDYKASFDRWKRYAETMKARGVPVEHIAKRVSNARLAARYRFQLKTPFLTRMSIYARNITPKGVPIRFRIGGKWFKPGGYGNIVGPNWKFHRARGVSWEDILEKALRPNVN